MARHFDVYDYLQCEWSDKNGWYHIEVNLPDSCDEDEDLVYNFIDNTFAEHRKFLRKGKKVYRSFERFMSFLQKKFDNEFQFEKFILTAARKHAARGYDYWKDPISHDLPIKKNKFHEILELNKKIRELQAEKAKLLGK